jgi:WD40 repeat protein
MAKKAVKQVAKKQAEAAVAPKPVRTLGKPGEGTGQAVRSLAFAPDGRTLASGGADHMVRLWDRRTGDNRRMMKAEYQVEHVVFSPDGKVIA